MKTPQNFQKRMKSSTLGQIGLIAALGLSLVGFEYANVDLIRNKVTTSKLETISHEVVYDKIEIEKPDVPEENREEKPNQQSNQQNQQTSTNIQTTTDPSQVTTNVGVPPSDTTLLIVDVFKKQKADHTDQIFDIVEEMPTYKNLIPIKNKDDRNLKTQKEILSNVYKTIKYPEMARQAGIQGKVYVSFVVNKAGEITDVKVLKSVHSALDDEAVRAVKTLPGMVPGKQLDRPVNVRFTIPIIFSLKN